MEFTPLEERLMLRSGDSSLAGRQKQAAVIVAILFLALHCCRDCREELHCRGNDRSHLCHSDSCGKALLHQGDFRLPRPCGQVRQNLEREKIREPGGCSRLPQFYGCSSSLTSSNHASPAASHIQSPTATLPPVSGGVVKSTHSRNHGFVPI